MSMARPLRLEFAGALYHVTARGDRREDIYENDEDRKAFLSLLADVCELHTGCATPIASWIIITTY
jgi:putative transposase